MHIHQNIGKILAMAVAGCPALALAQLEIISKSGRVDEINNIVPDDGVFKRVVDIGDRKFINHPINSFAKDIPLGAVLSTIVPSDWTIKITDSLASEAVTWDKSGNWDDVVVEIAGNHDFVVVFDWNRNVVEMKTNDAEMLPIIKSKNADSSRPAQDIETIDESSMKIVDSLLLCAEVGAPKEHESEAACKDKKVDIEKLVLDTDWIAEKTPEAIGEIEDDIQDGSGSTGKAESYSSAEDAADIEANRESDALRAAMEADAKMRNDYKNAHILHGNGSYEDFVNSGGRVEKADPDKEYIYVFKKGKLFNSISKWAELNGYYVKNDIFDNRKIDFPNSQEIKIKGKFKDVVTLLLNRYRVAEIPVNHKYFNGGGSNAIHIFESKFETSHFK